MIGSRLNKKYFAEREIAKKKEIKEKYASNRMQRRGLVSKIRLHEEESIKEFWLLTEGILVSNLISDSIKLYNLNSFTDPCIDFFDLYNELWLRICSAAIDNSKLLLLIDSNAESTNYERYLHGIYKNIKFKMFSEYSNSSKYKEILYNYSELAFEKLIQENKEKSDKKVISNFTELGELVDTSISEIKNKTTKKIMELWWNEKMNNAKISEVLQISYEQVTLHIHRGKKYIRKKYIK